MHRLTPHAALLAACVFAGAAAADPAPIVYAGQGAPAPAPLAGGLAGGGGSSYGYGGERERGGAVIDLRRAGGAQRAQTDPAPVGQTAGEQGAQPWLERERAGPPYEANGRWYVPTPEPGYAETGQASWYGPTFHGQRAANGEIFDQEALTAAHPTLPLNSLVQVTNLENGREAVLRVTDRGPFVGERLIDLSHGAAVVLGFDRVGGARVHVRYLGPAPRRVDAQGSALPAAIAPPDGPLSLQAPPQAPAQSAPTFGAYVVQVGAFSDPGNAERVRAAAEAAGPVILDTRQTASGELTRVRVGPYSSPEEAAAAQLALADLGFAEAVVAAR